MFDNLTNIIYFELRNVGLESMEQINFRNFQQLEHLDLPFNLLTELRYESFEFLKKLKFLELKNNKISVVNSSIFLKIAFNEKNLLEYLNLENNRIISFGSILTNYLNLELFRSFNRLKSIKPNIFRGLNYLNDLYLMNQVMFQLHAKSLSHLINVGSIYINELMVREFKCFIY